MPSHGSACCWPQDTTQRHIALGHLPIRITESCLGWKEPQRRTTAIMYLCGPADGMFSEHQLMLWGEALVSLPIPMKANGSFSFSFRGKPYIHIYHVSFCISLLQPCPGNQLSEFSFNPTHPRGTSARRERFLWLSYPLRYPSERASQPLTIETGFSFTAANPPG